VAICINGAAVVQVATGRVLDEHGMPPVRVAELARRLRAAGGPAVHLAVERAAGFAAERGYQGGHVAPPGSPLVDRIEEALTASTLKLLVRADDAGTDLDAFVGRVAAAVGTLAEVSHSGARGLAEIGPPGVSKATALARWAASLGVAAGDVWAAGDAPNDLPMLAWAGLACAVANAHPAVLAAAARVLPANDDDGVAVLLEEAVRACVGAGRA
jgi:hydroxymethylpyrimidine pyrophosphatase-like HAD family hydrolase